MKNRNASAMSGFTGFIASTCVLVLSALIQCHCSAADGPGAVLVFPGSEWRYLDTGTNLGTIWRDGFDDSAWASGHAPLGYGEANQATTVSFGPDQDNKYVTTYFRQAFYVPQASDYNHLYLRVLRDDGVVIYLNGTEVFRNNMPGGTVGYRTLAATNVYDGAESVYYEADFGSTLVSGTNIIAAEVHQAGGDSIDLNFDLELSASNIIEVTRGPYLQMGTPTSVIVRWRTALPTNSRVQYGTNVNDLGLSAEDATATSEHEVLLNELEPNTRYYYEIGSSTRVAVTGPDCFFVTAPSSGKPTRIWVIGDTRTGDNNQAAVRDAYYAFAGDNYTDLWLMMGDDGGPDGSDAGFTQCLFDFYPTKLRQTVVWPTLGNHETYYNPLDPAYFHVYSLPIDGQAGGVASGTEQYYSFNYGNIHFVVLDSIMSDLTAQGEMYLWLEQDLAAANSDWLIAYWHSPPYSKGGHDSDWEWDLIQMRQTFVPLLEAYGVDLVLCGHSHVYERSYLLDGFYGYSYELDPATMVKNYGDGRRNGDGPYVKASTGLHAHEGTVYVVVGSSGLLSGGQLNHPAMYLSENQLGSLVLDVDGNTLEARFLRETGAIDDYFTIIKGGLPLMVHITDFKAQEGRITLTWNTVAGRYYTVLRQDTLSADGFWTAVVEYVLGDGTPLSWTDDPLPGPTAFYRIQEISLR